MSSSSIIYGVRYLVAEWEKKCEGVVTLVRIR